MIPDDPRARTADLDRALAEALATLKLLAAHRAAPVHARIRGGIGRVIRLLDPETPTP